MIAVGSDGRLALTRPQQIPKRIYIVTPEQHPPVDNRPTSTSGRMVKHRLRRASAGTTTDLKTCPASDSPILLRHSQPKIPNDLGLLGVDSRYGAVSGRLLTVSAGGTLNGHQPLPGTINADQSRCCSARSYGPACNGAYELVCAWSQPSGMRKADQDGSG
jgi:hypothetical protein